MSQIAGTVGRWDHVVHDDDMGTTRGFEMVVAGAFTAIGRGTFLYGPYTGDLPHAGDPLRLSRSRGVAVEVTCIGIEDMLRTDRSRDFAVHVSGVDADEVTGGELLVSV